MTLFERLRGWLTPAGRDIGDKRYGEALYTTALANAEAWEDDIDLFVDPIAEASAEAMADEWANEGGAPAGKVPNCS